MLKCYLLTFSNSTKQRTDINDSKKTLTFSWLVTNAFLAVLTDFLFFIKPFVNHLRQPIFLDCFIILSHYQT